MRRLCRFAAGFAAGCAAWVLGIRTVVLAALALACVAGLFLSVHRRSLRAQKVRALTIGLLAALVWCAGYDYAALSPVRLKDAQENTQITMEVREYPSRTKYGYSALVRVKTGGRSVPAVLYYPQETAIEPGDTVRCEGTLRAATGQTLERDMYYASRGVWMTASAKGKLQVQKGSFSVRYLPALAAERLKTACRAIFAPEVSGFMTALLTGDKSGLSYAIRNELSLAGIYHAVAVSGMHVSLLAGLLLLLFPGRRKLTAGVGIFLVWFFVLLTGAPASATRAGVMQTMLLLAPLVRRERDTPTALAAALVALLLENPWSIANVGLQLSFASTAGILLFAQPLSRYVLEGSFFEKVKRRSAFAARCLRSAGAAVCCSLASSVFSLPICAAYFGILSLSGFLTNALCLWAIGILFPAGLVLCGLAAVCLPLALGPGWVLSWLARLVLLIVHAMAKLPYGAISLECPYAAFWAVLFYGFTALCCLWPGKIRMKLALPVLAGTFALCMGLAALDYSLPGFTFTALDVGQGQCLLYTAGGETTIVDCGGAQDESGETAARYLLGRGVFGAERLILTHLDADHCNGAAQLLSRVHVKTLLLPATAEDGEMLQGLLQAAGRYGTEIQFVDADLTFTDKNTEITVFGPDLLETGNDGGLCVLASHEKYDILITGDLSQMAEYRLLSRAALPEVQLLVAGHHGAKTSTSQALLDTVRAQTVVISVGEGNSYGHPADETLARILASGAAIYRTDEHGTISVRGGTYGKKTDGGQRR